MRPGTYRGSRQSNRRGLVASMMPTISLTIHARALHVREGQIFAANHLGAEIGRQVFASSLRNSYYLAGYKVDAQCVACKRQRRESRRLQICTQASPV